MGQYDRKAQSAPKHGKPNDSGASKAPVRPAQVQPAWKGPSYMPKKKRKPLVASATPEPMELQHTIPPKLEQAMLEIFRTTFPVSSDFEALKPTLVAVKDAMVGRDFNLAFGREEHREAYAIRWSPSRALVYAQLLAWICAEKADDPLIRQLNGTAKHPKAANVVCFGGGAAELMAVAGLVRSLRPSEAAGKPDVPVAEDLDSLEGMSVSAPNPPASLLRVSLLDAADWSSVLFKLTVGLETPPTLSKYASATARATNAPYLVPGALEHKLKRADSLTSTTENLRAAIGTEPSLMTLMFTLNELYTTSMPRTTALLKRITEATPVGSLLLVVDSHGTYSEIIASSADGGKEKRKYPMNLLLDYALVPKSKKKAGREDSDEEEPTRAWEKIMEKANMVYKLDESLRYPVSLENTRFQVHLFRRV